MIWKNKPSTEQLNKMCKETVIENLGIIFTEVGDDYLTATMPVDRRTVQPFKILHGGSSCVLSESLGSIAAHFCVDQSRFFPIGLDINANHIKAAQFGEKVSGTASPIHVGKSTHVWEIKIKNEGGELICISRLTMSVIAKK